MMMSNGTGVSFEARAEQSRYLTVEWKSEKETRKTYEQRDEQRLNQQFGLVLVVVVFRLSRHWKDRLSVRMTFQGSARKER